MKIHPTAIVDQVARVDPSVVIGPYSIISGAVTLEQGVVIGPFCKVRGQTVIGAGTIVDSYASIGGDPQDKKSINLESRLKIGKNNHIREFTTINRGATTTTIGDGNWFMAYSHVAHDCTIGNNCTFSNGATLGGHVSVGDWVTFGGLSAVHQWCRIGMGAMVAGGAMVVQDVPPYCIAQGDRAKLVGINRVGLRRLKVATAQIDDLHTAYRKAFLTHQALGKVTEDGLRNLHDDSDELLKQFWTFFTGSKRGFCKGRKRS